jgi:15-cis-phytoene synthase
MTQLEQRIFRQGSTTYYWSARFFPKSVRNDVMRFYSFVRVVDDYVDALPPRSVAFRQLYESWQRMNTDGTTALTSADTTEERIVKNIVSLSRTHHFEPSWVPAFWAAMQADLKHQPYQRLQDTLRYTYGSAEVIGLMLCHILRLPTAAYTPAALQGRAMQWINFIRDIAEDNELGRLYFPQEDLQRFELPDLHRRGAELRPEAFTAFMRFQVDRYRRWQREASKGHHYLPRRLRLPVRTAVDMYDWTAECIARDPFIVFSYKVKPTPSRVVRRALIRAIR